MSHDPTKNVTRTPEEIGVITGTMSAVLNGHIGYDCRPGDWKIERSECGTTITFTDLMEATSIDDTLATMAPDAHSPQPEQVGQIITADEVQPGDKIEVRWPALIVDGIGGNLASGAISASSARTLISSGATIRLIERPEKPIAVGDRVHDMPMEKDEPFAIGTVRHVEDGWASVKWDGQPGLGVSNLRYLTRAPVSSSA